MSTSTDQCYSVSAENTNDYIMDLNGLESVWNWNAKQFLLRANDRCSDFIFDISIGYREKPSK